MNGYRIFLFLYRKLYKATDRYIKTLAAVFDHNGQQAASLLKGRSQSYLRTLSALFFTILINFPGPLYAQEVIHHDMKLLLKPEINFIEVEDKITISEKVSTKAKKLTFSLHENFQPVSATPGINISPSKMPPQSADFNINSSAKGKVLKPKQYEIMISSDIQSFTLRYKGTIYHPIERQGQEYARSFSETPGLISPKGIYLGETSSWYPRFDNYILTFTLDVKTPKGWKIVSQGRRTKQSEDKEWEWVRWESPEPQEEIYLIGGKFIEYKQTSEGVQSMVFLRQPDEQLA